MEGTQRCVLKRSGFPCTFETGCFLVDTATQQAEAGDQFAGEKLPLPEEQITGYIVSATEKLKAKNCPFADAVVEQIQLAFEVSQTATGEAVE